MERVSRGLLAADLPGCEARAEQCYANIFCTDCIWKELVANTGCGDGCAYCDNTEGLCVGRAAAMSNVKGWTTSGEFVVTTYSITLSASLAPYDSVLGFFAFEWDPTGFYHTCNAYFLGSECLCQLRYCDAEQTETAYYVDCSAIDGGAVVDYCNPLTVEDWSSDLSLMEKMMLVPPRVCSVDPSDESLGTIPTASNNVPAPVAAPVAAPIAAPTNSPWLCFSGSTVVQVKDKGAIAMDALKIGDFVAAGSGSFSKVYSFGHHAPNATTPFLEIVAGTTALEITADHMLYVHASSDEEPSLLPAGSVQVGDLLTTMNGGVARVQSIRHIQRQGAFAPFTESGNIVVSGALASNYVSLRIFQDYLAFNSQHALVHTAHAPYRVYCSLLGCENEAYDEATGLSAAVSIWIPVLHVIDLVLCNLATLVAAAVGYYSWKHQQNKHNALGLSLSKKNKNDGEVEDHT